MIDVDYNEYKETLSENMKLIVENHRLEEVEKEHQKLNGGLREKIERLNNIINELEKMMKNDLECACSMNENGLFNGAIDILEVYLDKLQELIRREYESK